MMDIRVLTSDKASDSLLAQTKPLTPLLQSSAWAEMQAAYGRRVFRFGAYDGTQLLGLVTAIEHQITLNRKYLYVPHGPISSDHGVTRALIEHLVARAEREQAMYIKVDPPHLTDAWPEDVWPKGFTLGTALQPRHTYVVPLEASSDELFAKCHQKTRYNIRLAEKRGVTIRWSTDDRDVETFLALQHEMATRQGIRPHPDRYYRVMFDAFRKANMVQLGIAEFNGKPLAINEVVFDGTTATFTHGGSSNEHREVMAPALLQWQTILQAKERGMKHYDLRGIAPADQPNHKLAGVTRFKMGFPGEVMMYPKARNLVLQPAWYWAYRFAKRLRGGQED